MIGNRNQRGKARGDLVASSYTSAPCIAAANEVVVSADVDCAEILEAGGDGQLVSCLDGVFSSNRPLGLFVVVVGAGSPCTRDAKRARTDVSRDDCTDCAVFLVRIVTAEQVGLNAAELGTDDGADADIVRPGFVRPGFERAALCDAEF